MKITRIGARVYRIPTHRPMHDAIRHFSTMDVVLAQIETDQGTCGTGFTYSIISHGATEVASLIRSSINELLVGQDPLDHERNWQHVWRKLDWVGRGGIAILALSAVDIALWDLKSRYLELPLHQLLGGFRKSVPVYNTDGGWLNHSIAELQRETKMIVERGFSGTKIKVGKDSAHEDTERIAAVREVLGPSRTLMVDANERFSHPEAIRRAAMWEKFDLFWFEEPLRAEDISGHAKLKRQCRIPIAIGESLFTRQQFKEYVSADGASLLQPDACRCGGITEWLKIAHYAECHDLQLSPHFVMELHLPLVAAIPNGLFVEYIPSLDAVLEAPLTLRNGCFDVDPRPGAGVAWDFEKLERYAV